MVNQSAPITPMERAPGTLAAALSIAVVIAAFGWFLVLQAGWQAAQVGTALGGYAVLAITVAIAAAWHLKSKGFGVANQITLMRTGLVCLVGGALLGGAKVSWSLAGVIGLALCLDAVDGWLARRLGLASRFGARFDLEIDALTILILSVLVWQTGRTGLWVLAIGGMRYAFVALGMIWPAGRRPLPPSFRRKTVCALIGVLLLICLLPATPPWLASGAAALALLSQLASFAIDLVWLRGRAAAGGANLIDAHIPSYSPGSGPGSGDKGFG
jgi:phosphatidylglycerophosphate synthase